MHRERSESNVAEKWKTYITGIMTKRFMPAKKLDKYFRSTITESTSRAIEENWIRKLGIDNEIISVNISKSNEPLGIAIEGRNVFSSELNEFVQRHYLRVIVPKFCIGSSNRFLVGDELLEVNGLMIYGMQSTDVVNCLKKLPIYLQMVVARSLHTHDDDIIDNDESDGMSKPISFYDMDGDVSSKTSTLKSNSSFFSTTSRDYNGSTTSVGGLIDGHFATVGDYLRDIVGWRGPIVLEFRKQHKESLGLALEEIQDPTTSELIIVFKIIVPNMKSGKDGRLHVGDRLLEVNGKSVKGIMFKKVCQWMKSAPGGKLILYICKPHFRTSNSESTDYLHDNSTYNTLTVSDKLPKLKEEGDEESIVIPPLPEHFENCIVIKRESNKLGLYLDIVDEGKNGCRIKKIVKGLAKDNGILQEGDYITQINEFSLKINERNRLENCLTKIAKSKSDYKIRYFTKEDIDVHNFKYTGSVNEKKSPSLTKSLYPSHALSAHNYDDPSINTSYNQFSGNNGSFEMYHVSLKNDGVTNLGLIIFPSINEPNRFVAIADIHAGSLADKSQLLKINDTILAVNNKSFEYLTPSDAALYLKKMMQTDDILEFKIKRLINVDGESRVEENTAVEVYNEYPILSDLPDFYFCTLSKSNLGYGLYVKELVSNYGIEVKEIELGGSAYKTGVIKAGHRFIKINNESVINSSVDNIIKMVKNSKYSLCLLMETPKYREFDVKIVKDDSNSLGLIIGGGIDTKYSLPIIENIKENTTCQFSELLQNDDFIIKVNELSLVNKNHEEIIKILRSLPHESCFKIWRKLPFCQRDFLNNTNQFNFLNEYLQNCQFSVTINKPVKTVPSYGINFGDILILDPSNNEIIHRYKVVISVEKSSLFEKYAPEVTPYCYIIRVNNAPIDINISCNDLKTMIDSENRVELLFSRDIPYDLDVFKCNDSSIVMNNIAGISYESSKEIDSSSEGENKRVYFEPCSNINTCDTNIVKEEFPEKDSFVPVDGIIQHSKVGIQVSCQNIEEHIKNQNFSDSDKYLNSDEFIESHSPKIECPHKELKFNEADKQRDILDEHVIVNDKCLDDLEESKFCEKDKPEYETEDNLIIPKVSEDQKPNDDNVEMSRINCDDKIQENESFYEHSSSEIIEDCSKSTFFDEEHLEEPKFCEKNKQQKEIEDSSISSTTSDENNNNSNERKSPSLEEDCTEIKKDDKLSDDNTEDLQINNENKIQENESNFEPNSLGVEKDCTKISCFDTDKSQNEKIVENDSDKPSFNDEDKPQTNQDIFENVDLDRNSGHEMNEEKRSKDNDENYFSELTVLEDDKHENIENQCKEPKLVENFKSLNDLNDNNDNFEVIDENKYNEDIDHNDDENKNSQPKISEETKHKSLNDLKDNSENIEVIDENKYNEDVDHNDGENNNLEPKTSEETKHDDNVSGEERNKEIETIESQKEIIESVDSKKDIDNNISFQNQDNITDEVDSLNNPEVKINVTSIIVPRVENTELGFQILGGVGSGPEGETLPICVVGVEKNSCNWPLDMEKPLLNNGFQLLELNGCDLTNLDMSTIEKLIATTEGDLEFKVFNFQ